MSFRIRRSDIHAEGLARSVELRRQKWRVKQRELELIAARNQLLPRLDVNGIYRFVGLGQDLFNNNPSNINGTGITWSAPALWACSVRVNSRNGNWGRTSPCRWASARNWRRSATTN